MAQKLRQVLPVWVFALATQPVPGRVNEDFVIATSELAIVIDGAGLQGRCRHSVAWYASQLGQRVLSSALDYPDLPLVKCLARGIDAVNALHADTCNLSEGCPSAAIGIIRVRPEVVDVLSLSDVAVVVDTGDEPHVYCDLTMEECTESEVEVLRGLRLGTPEHKAALADLVSRQVNLRNRDGGWWIASSDPTAAQHAITATLPRAEVHRVALLSDGAARPVQQMGIHTWQEYLDILDEIGPVGLIDHVRFIESADPEGDRHPRTKQHDDATVCSLVA